MPPKRHYHRKGGFSVTKFLFGRENSAIDNLGKTLLSIPSVLSKAKGGRRTRRRKVAGAR